MNYGPSRRKVETVATGAAEVSAIVVTYNAKPWIEPCLESVRGCELIVVDNGSSDGTPELVRDRFPEARLSEQQNRGLGAGWNAGMRAASGKWFFLLNADAWVVADGIANAGLARVP